MLDYTVAVGKPKRLTPRQRRARLYRPDIAEAQKRFGYDSNIGQLYYKDEEGGVSSYVASDTFSVKVKQKRCAVWRVKSAVLLGSVDGKLRGYVKDGD